MTDQETIAILVRWVRELQVDLLVAESDISDLEYRVLVLERRIAGYGYWIRAGLTPTDIRDAGRELAQTVIA